MWSHVCRLWSLTEENAKNMKWKRHRRNF